jgi:hypothetical protein
MILVREDAPMQGRRRQNAVSARVVAVAFVLLGPAIAVAALLAEAEPYVLAFAVIAYVCIAGPIFLAAASTSGSPQEKHRSFRVTPPWHMEGKRVKRRLLWSAYLGYLAGGLGALAVMVLTVLGIARLKPAEAGVPGDRIWESLLIMGLPLGAYCLALLAARGVFVRLGWMTREEAQPFPFRMQTHRWPDSWLEPLDERESPERDAPEERAAGPTVLSLITMVLSASTFLGILIYQAAFQDMFSNADSAFPAFSRLALAPAVPWLFGGFLLATMVIDLGAPRRLARECNRLAFGVAATVFAFYLVASLFPLAALVGEIAD